MFFGKPRLLLMIDWLGGMDSFMIFQGVDKLTMSGDAVLVVVVDDTIYNASVRMSATLLAITESHYTSIFKIILKMKFFNLPKDDVTYGPMWTVK